MAFKNKVVLVTGSGSGIGAAAVTIFAKKGANIVIVDSSKDRANNSAEKCREFGNKVLVITADVSKNEDAEMIIEQTINTYGRLDVLVNNAGIVKVGNILDGNVMDSFDEVMNTNLRAVVLMTSLAAPYLVKTKGCIVNTSSVVTLCVKAAPAFPAYCVSKAGVDAFTRSSALELAPTGVRVNAVNPGPVRTNIKTHSGLSGGWDDVAEQTALRKCSDPEEIANLIVYLASDKAKSITGSCYVIDNGMMLT